MLVVGWLVIKSIPVVITVVVIVVVFIVFPFVVVDVIDEVGAPMVVRDPVVVFGGGLDEERRVGGSDLRPPRVAVAVVAVGRLPRVDVAVVVAVGRPSHGDRSRGGGFRPFLLDLGRRGVGFAIEAQVARVTLSTAGNK